MHVLKILRRVTLVVCPGMGKERAGSMYSVCLWSRVFKLLKKKIKYANAIPLEQIVVLFTCVSL